MGRDCEIGQQLAPFVTVCRRRSAARPVWRAAHAPLDTMGHQGQLCGAAAGPKHLERAKSKHTMASRNWSPIWLNLVAYCSQTVTRSPTCTGQEPECGCWILYNLIGGQSLWLASGKARAEGEVETGNCKQLESTRELWRPGRCRLRVLPRSLAKKGRAVSGEQRQASRHS